jgi:hypothetical protein
VPVAIQREEAKKRLLRVIHFREGRLHVGPPWRSGLARGREHIGTALRLIGRSKHHIRVVPVYRRAIHFENRSAAWFPACPASSSKFPRPMWSRVAPTATTCIYDQQVPRRVLRTIASHYHGRRKVRTVRLETAIGEDLASAVNTEHRNVRVLTYNAYDEVAACPVHEIGRPSILAKGLTK